MTGIKVRKITARFLAMLLSVIILTSAAGVDLRAAAEEYEPIDLTEKCTLTVYRIGEGSEYEEDAAQAEGIVADIYKIAEAVPVEGMDIFDLKLKAPFDDATVKTAAKLSGEDGVIKLDGKITAEDWSAISQAAAALVKEADGAIEPEYKDCPTGEGTVIPEAGLDAGLYLLLVRTDDDDYWYDSDEDSDRISTVAYSDRYNYIYAPQLVILPYKSSTMTAGAESKTSDEAPWSYDVSIYLKPETEPRAADLTIHKVLTNYRGTKAATFVFQVEATITKNGQTKTVYSNAVSVEFPSDGEKTITIARAIPVGANVTVTEVYSGPGCKLLTDRVVTGVMTENGLERDSDGVVGSAHFENDGGHKDGGSILNHYTYVEETEADGTKAGDWTGPVNTDGTVTVN